MRMWSSAAPDLLAWRCNPRAARFLLQPARSLRLIGMSAAFLCHKIRFHLVFVSTSERLDVPIPLNPDSKCFVEFILDAKCLELNSDLYFCVFGKAIIGKVCV